MKYPLKVYTGTARDVFRTAPRTVVLSLLSITWLVVACVWAVVSEGWHGVFIIACIFAACIALNRLSAWASRKDGLDE